MAAKTKAMNDVATKKPKKAAVLNKVNKAAAKASAKAKEAMKKAKAKIEASIFTEDYLGQRLMELERSADEQAKRIDYLEELLAELQKQARLAEEDAARPACKAGESAMAARWRSRSDF